MRRIPIALQDHLDTGSTRLCYLLKITAQDGTVLGVTSLDQDVTYDDGSGSVTYSAAIGLDQSPLANTPDLQVDNSEGTMLLAETGTFTEEKIEAGLLDYAQFVIYRVNWSDLTQGHIIVQTGTTGAVRAADGMAGVVELRGLPQGLKQTMGELYSLTCRARFGSGSSSGAPGSRPTVTDTDISFVNNPSGTSDVIVRDGGTAWASASFTSGSTILVSGSTRNDGAYEVLTVTDKYLYLTTDSPSLETEGAGETVTVTQSPATSSAGCPSAFTCGFDAESLYQNHSVSAVGAEPDRIFTADTTPAVNGPNGALSFVPGVLVWLTGDNAGLVSEVEAMAAAVITLRFGTPYTIQATDTFKVRPDCDKTMESCINDFDNFLNFRGEPLIAGGDESSSQIPGAAAGTISPYGSVESANTEPN